MRELIDKFEHPKLASIAVAIFGIVGQPPRTKRSDDDDNVLDGEVKRTLPTSAVLCDAWYFAKHV